MSIIKSVLVVASLVVAASAANAQTREDLNSGFHGNTPAAASLTIAQDARGAFAQAGNGVVVRTPAKMNPLNDMFHGLAVR